MVPNEKVLKTKLGLFEYRVTLVEKDTKQTIDFDCFATDGVHALEQAKNAYPGCTEMMSVRNTSYEIVPSKTS